MMIARAVVLSKPTTIGGLFVDHGSASPGAACGPHAPVGSGGATGSVGALGAVGTLAASMAPIVVREGG